MFYVDRMGSFSVFLLLSGCGVICFGQYTFDDSHGVGRTFDGIGGLSGGGVSVSSFFSF